MFLQYTTKQSEDWFEITCPAIELYLSEKTEAEATKALVSTATEMAENFGLEMKLAAKNGLLEADDSSQLIALVIKRLRTKRDMTQKTLADALDSKSRNSVIRLEQGENQISIGKLEAVLAEVDPSLRVGIVAG